MPLDRIRTYLKHSKVSCPTYIVVAIVASSGEENIKEKQEAATAFAFESRASFPIPLFYKFKLKTRKILTFRNRTILKLIVLKMDLNKISVPQIFRNHLYRDRFKTVVSRNSKTFSVKFIYSEKATKFCQIFTLLLTGTT